MPFRTVSAIQPSTRSRRWRSTICSVGSPATAVPSLAIASIIADATRSCAGTGSCAPPLSCRDAAIRSIVDFDIFFLLFALCHSSHSHCA